MLVGVVSDTHDSISAVRKAVEYFNMERVGLVVHCGDFIAPFSLRVFSGLKCKLVGVYGNNDGDKPLLAKIASELGFEVHEGFYRFEIDGRGFIMFHGFSSIDFTEKLADALTRTMNLNVIYGHTHRFRFEKRGEYIILNPGEACGYLSGNSTVALLDSETLEVSRILL